MKTLNALLVVTAFASFTFCSCRSSQSNIGTPVKFVTHKEAADTQRIVAKDTTLPASAAAVVPDIPVKYRAMTSDDAKKFLNEVHLEKVMHSGMGEGGSPMIYNGFFGTDHYRIEFYFSEVLADTSNPFVLQVKGKDRYKKAVTPFAGKFTIDSVFSFNDLNFDYSEYLEYSEYLKYAEYLKNADSHDEYSIDTFVTTSHMKGTFELYEDPDVKGSGVFTGNIYIDLVKSHERGYGFWFNTPNETRRGGLLLDGMWTSNLTKEQKPVLGAVDLFMFANDILEEFSYGEREIEINPEYRDLGWDNYWANEEWWSTDEKELMMIWNY